MHTAFVWDMLMCNNFDCVPCAILASCKSVRNEQVILKSKLIMTIQSLWSYGME